MAKDNSVVKSFRTTEEQFAKANEIFQKEGFGFSEVIRLLLEATIKEGRIPRGLSTKDMEQKLDDARHIENYVDSILSKALPMESSKTGTSTKEKLLNVIFGERTANNMSNAALREWGDTWGLPDNLSVSTLADLHECGYFCDDPWDGVYDYEIKPELTPGSTQIDHHLEEALMIRKYEQNLNDNMEQLKRKLQTKAIKVLIESGNIRSDKED